MKWRTVHPCLLPKKKYVYLTQSAAFVNPGKEFLFALQGLTPAELHGLPERLTFGQCSDLLGNAFTSNVVATVALGAMLYVLT